ncbi:ABC transporter ATP-binding protein [Fulvivirgaceae bacterium BMA10]|uniref:ABC transporter ATP-binding protein n=1 Tax=Splendidivirga corallicola TaxID=3051826 RepID=A0ABT8KIM0_9BACT|nr:ABC transporter ATP-binding protein [Fulvivirgaceae bacterium BMA10]
MRILEVQNAFKKFSGNSLGSVQNVSFGIEEGELLALVGENGSGKTTLLRLIAGLEELDSGVIYLDQERITGPSENLVPGHPKIKMVHQAFQLSKNLTVIDNIKEVLKGYTAEYKKIRIEALLSLCKLEHLAHQKPKTLSGGEQQRLAFARAIADEPLLLLLDEPFSNLDVMQKHIIKHEVLDMIKHSGTTAILVTHDAQEALSLADGIAVIKDGQLLQYDKPEVIYRNPTSPYVAQFFGPTNIIESALLNGIIPIETGKDHTNTMICIRAEDIRITWNSSDDNLKGKVIRKDYLGAHTDLEVMINNDLKFIVRTNDQNIRLGDVLYLEMDRQKIHYFQ